MNLGLSIALTAYFIGGFITARGTYADLEYLSDRIEKDEDLSDIEEDLAYEADLYHRHWGKLFIPALMVIDLLFWLPIKVYVWMKKK